MAKIGYLEKLEEVLFISFVRVIGTDNIKSNHRGLSGVNLGRLYSKISVHFVCKEPLSDFQNIFFGYGNR